MSAGVVLKTDKIEGSIVFRRRDSEYLQVSGSITGLSPGLHGFHVHTRGDLRQGCTSLLGHFNPTNVNNEILENLIFLCPHFEFDDIIFGKAKYVICQLIETSKILTFN